jgi:hypothetical protein
MVDGNHIGRGLAARLFWFAILWLAGVMTVGAVALLIRSVLM